MDNLLRPLEVCKMLNIHRQTLHRMVHSGDIPAYRVSGAIRFKPSDVEQYIIGNMVVTHETTR
jgi:excisionase family DNA binding protein